MVNPVHKKNTPKKGTALMDYVMSAIMFALVLGVTVLQLNPHLIKNYFQHALGRSENNGSQIQLKILGE